MDWLKALDIAALVPEQYAAYRPLVAEGLRFFVGRLSSRYRAEAEREQFVQLVLGALTLDAGRVGRAVSALSLRPLDPAALDRAVADALGELHRGVVLPGFDWLLGLLDGLAGCGAARFPADLLFFRKALLSLSGVVGDLSGRDALDRGVIHMGVARFLGELLSRAGAPADSRAFGTHVSNADLAGLWLSWPLTAARLWVGLCQDALSVVAGPRVAAAARA